MEPEKIRIICPYCDAINAVPKDRPAKAAKCGKCHQPLFAGSPVDLDSARFDRHVSRSDIPVVVDFWAPWCGPCKAMAPQFNMAAEKLTPHVRLAKINTQVNPTATQRYRIQGIPAFILFAKGREVARAAGARPAGDLVNFVKSKISVPA